jgi:hypothetical protein
VDTGATGVTGTAPVSTLLTDVHFVHGTFEGLNGGTVTLRGGHSGNFTWSWDDPSDEMTITFALPGSFSSSTEPTIVATPIANAGTGATVLVNETMSDHTKAVIDIDNNSVGFSFWIVGSN